MVIWQGKVIEHVKDKLGSRIDASENTTSAWLGDTTLQEIPLNLCTSRISLSQQPPITNPVPIAPAREATTLELNTIQIGLHFLKYLSNLTPLQIFNFLNTVSSSSPTENVVESPPNVCNSELASEPLAQPQNDDDCDEIDLEGADDINEVHNFSQPMSLMQPSLLWNHLIAPLTPLSSSALYSLDHSSMNTPRSQN